jgi:hypothetical protein
LKLRSATASPRSGHDRKTVMTPTPTPTPTQVETTAEPSTPFRRLLDAMEDYAQLPAERRRRYRYTEDPSIVGVRHELQQSWLRSAVRHRFPDGLVPAKGTPPGNAFTDGADQSLTNAPNAHSSPAMIM